MDALVVDLLGRLASTSPAEICQAFFVLSAAFIFSIQILPDRMRNALMDYGARRHQKNEVNGKKPENGTDHDKGFLDVLTSYGQVPHSWFFHFYIASVAWSCFWAWQYVTQGSVMRAIAQLQTRSVDGQSSTSSVELGSTLAAWFLMSLQGGRRLYESLCVSKPGSTPMWCVHWALGLVYYTVMGISVWIQGSGAILQSWESPAQIRIFTPRIIAGGAVFLFACSQQYRCHRHLAGLKKYTLPTEGWFRLFVCPHYTFESLLYLSLAVVAAPAGSLWNRSVICGLIFVTTNIGATAYGTKRWYASKFGDEAVAGRWMMIPFLF